MPDHHQAVADLTRRVERTSSLKARAGSDIAAAVQGHRGDSTVSVAASGSGAQVTISGPDAAEHRAEVHQAAVAALKKER